MTHKAVFLDRDDTLITSDSGPINSPDQIELLPSVGQSLAMLKKMGYRLVVVTNQPGVAGGLITEEALEKVHHHLTKMLADEQVYLDAIYYCPYHPEGTVEGYTRQSDLRKPQPGMLLKAAEDLDIDLSQSWMIGDSFRDVAAGHRAGCRTILLDTPGKPQHREPNDPDPDKRAVNLREAVNILRMFEFQQKAQAARTAKHDTAPDEEIEPPTTKKPDESAPQPSAIKQDVTPPPAQTAEPKPKIEQETQKAPPPLSRPETKAAPATSPAPQTANEPVDKSRPSCSTAAPQPQHTPPPTDNTHQLLEEILHRVKVKNRYDQYGEFSVFMLLAWLVQVLAAFSLVVSMWFWLDAERGAEAVQTMIGYAVALQLGVIALLLMHDKHK